MRLLTHGCVSHLPTDGSLPMTDDNNNNTAIDPIQIDEDVLSYTVKFTPGRGLVFRNRAANLRRRYP
jgi:hypothetical protein